MTGGPATPIPDDPSTADTPDADGPPSAPSPPRPSPPVVTPTVAERLIEEMVAWRASLRIALASVMTITVVGAFWLVADPDDGGRDLSVSVRAAGESLAGEPPTGPTTAPGATPDGRSPTSPATTLARARPDGPAGAYRPDGFVEPATTSGRSTAAATEPTTTTTAGADIAAPSAPIDPIPATPSTPPTSAAPTAGSDTTSSTPGTPTTAAAPSSSAPSTTTSTSAVAPTTTIVATTTTDPDPAPSSTAPTPEPTTVRVEAETGRLLGTATARADHEGHSGTGFVGDIINEGSGVELTLAAPEAGPTTFTVRYAAGNNGPADLRTLTVLVNGATVTTAQMQVTASWSDWAVVVGELDLLAGDNTITLLWAPGDTGWVNLDYIQIN
ncbi:MAG: CBM35 domain-containing protein [Actinomycetota bacterium]